MRDILTFILIKSIIFKGYLDLWHLHRHTRKARKKNDALLMKIIRDSQDTEYGKKYDFRNIRTVEDYRRKVPFSTYEDYKDYIMRMIMDDEKGLITNYPVIGFARTSGSTGEFKYIPATKPEVKVYTRYTLTTMMALTDKWCREKYGRGLKPGRGMFIMPSMNWTLPNGKPCTNIAQYSSDRLGFIYPYLIAFPFTKLFYPEEIEMRYVCLRLGLEDPNLAFIFVVFFTMLHDTLVYLQCNWEILVDDIEKGTISDISLAAPEYKEKLLKHLKPNPGRASELRKEFEKGFDETIVSRIWPNMSVIYGIYNGIFTPYMKSVRKMTKDIPYDNSIYGASEGLIAVTDELNTDRRILLAESLYYEFIPLDDESKVLSLDELEPGKEYEIVITNPAGLYRYRIKDVVKVESYLNDCPYILFSYRKGNLVSIAGEKTSENHVEKVIDLIEKESGCESIRWAITVDIEGLQQQYVLLLENKEGKDLSIYEEIADEALIQENPNYGAARAGLSCMKILNLKAGTFEAWKEKMLEKGTSPSQIKPVTVLDNDEKRDFFLSRIETRE